MANNAFQFTIAGTVFNFEYVTGLVEDTTKEWDMVLRIRQHEDNQSRVTVVKAWDTIIPQQLINTIAQKIFDRTYERFEYISIKIS